MDERFKKKLVNTSSLEVQKLTKNFGGIHAVDSLDFSVGKGELRCILGPNGAGKSTFFKLLAGTEKPTCGSIYYDGHNITSLKTFERSRLGIAIKFQNLGVYSNLTVAQNLTIPLQRHYRLNHVPCQMQEILHSLGLENTNTQLVGKLSHGQQQWLAIGMALAMRPNLLLLDEPVAGMSLEETEKTGEIIKSLNSKGVTIIVIEHDMTFVRQLSSLVTVFHLGRFFAQGTFQEIEHNEQVRQIYLGQSHTNQQMGSEMGQ